MPVGTALSKDDLKVLEVTVELWTSTSPVSTDELCLWAIACLRSYLETGSDPKVFADEAPKLLKLLEGHLQFTRESFQDCVNNPQFSAVEREEDRRCVAAAGELIERMRGEAKS